MPVERYVVHYPSPAQEFGLLGMLLTGIIVACWIPAMALLSGAIAMGILTGIWGAVAVAVMGPITVSLGSDTWTNLRRYRTIQFSIDLEGVFDGQTRTFLPWSHVTAVTFSRDGNGMVVLGHTWATSSAGGGPANPLLIRHFTSNLSGAEVAVREFAPHVRIDYVPPQDFQRLLRAN